MKYWLGDVVVFQNCLVKSWLLYTPAVYRDSGVTVLRNAPLAIHPDDSTLSLSRPQSPFCDRGVSFARGYLLDEFFHRDTRLCI